ncbi:MAG: lysozyme [Robiginitomaculum sp.]
MIKCFDKEWKKITLISYTMWAFYALAAITLAPDIVYILFEVDTNPAVWAGLQIAVCFAGVLGRLILQPQKNRWRRRAIIAVLITIAGLLSLPALAKTNLETKFGADNCAFNTAAFSLISKWEGKRNTSYRDIVGVWTICYGHTRTAGAHQYKTDEQCRVLLIEEIDEYRHGIRGYFTSQTKAARLPALRDAAYTSLAFNVGIVRAGKSTATGRLNSGNIIGGCNALTWWNRAGGRVVRGLVRRRVAERQYCLQGTRAA